MARALGMRMMRERSQGLAYGFRLATARAPSKSESTELQKYFDGQLASFRENPEAARKFVANGDAPKGTAPNACEQAAWTLTASLLLNLDEMQTQH